MPTVTTTVGGASSNSYISVADADTYFDERLNATAWTGASTTDKQRALIQATRRIDQEDWEGVKVATSQALDWPRYWATDEDGEEYDQDIIPQPVKDAVCELALRFLSDKLKGKDTLADTGMEEYDAARIGPMDVKKDKSFRAGQLPENVERLIAHIKTTAGASARMHRA